MQCVQAVTEGHQAKGNEGSFSLSHSEVPGTERSLLYQEINGFVFQL